MQSLLDLLRIETPLSEMVLRGTAVYWFLLIVFRFLLRRGVGSLGVADLLFVVLIADASSNAMQGDYKTIGDGLVLISTLIAWNYALDWASYHSPTVSASRTPGRATGQTRQDPSAHAAPRIDHRGGVAVKLREKGSRICLRYALRG